MGERRRRVWIVGPCGAGKSTLANELAARLGVEAIHLDDLHWLPGWEERCDLAMEQDLERRLAGPGWVVDGNYTRHRVRHLGRAERVVWLDLPFPLTFVRLLRRTWSRARGREPCCNGNQESWRRALSPRDSILVWALKTHWRKRRQLEVESAGDPRWVRLRSAAEVAGWLADPR